MSRFNNGSSYFDIEIMEAADGAANGYAAVLFGSDDKCVSNFTAHCVIDFHRTLAEETRLH
jgi:hypothetical protein